MSLDGRVALVTGAFRGIGRAGVGNHPGLPGPQSPPALTPRSQGFEGVFKLLPSQDFARYSSVGVPLATSRLRRGGIEH